MSTPATPPAGAATRGRGRKPRASPSGAASTSSPAAGPSQPTTPPTATSRRGRGKGGRGGKETTPTAAGDTSSSAAAAVVVAEQRRSEVPRERLKICVHGFPAKITAAQVLAQLPARHVEHISYCFVPAAKTVLLGFDSAAALQELCRDVQHNAVPGLPSLRVSYAPFQRLPRGVFLGLPDGEAATAGDEQEAEIYSHAGYLDFVRQLNTPPEAAPFQISGVSTGGAKTEPVITPLLEDLRRKRLAKLAQKKRKQQRSAAAKRAAAAAATPSATDDATPVDATAAPAKRRRNRPRGRNKARDAASAAAQPPDATPRPTPATPSDSSTPKQRGARRTAKPAAAAASNNNLRPDATPASAGEAKAPGTKFRRGRRGAAVPS